MAAALSRPVLITDLDDPRFVVVAPFVTFFAAGFEIATDSRTMLMVFAESRLLIEPEAGTVKFSLGGRIVPIDKLFQLFPQMFRKNVPVMFPRDAIQQLPACARITRDFPE